jgi:hypothetical protein
MSTAFQPETDGLTKPAFGIFQKIVRPLLMSFNGTGHAYRSVRVCVQQHIQRFYRENACLRCIRSLPSNCYDALRPGPYMPDADVNTAAKRIVPEAQRAMNAARKVLADTFLPNKSA